MLRSRVESEAAPIPLLQWLVQRFRYLDENGWRAVIAAGRLQRNGRPTGPDDMVHGGDEIAFDPPVPPTRQPEVDVPVLHADLDLVVVDKPPHRVVQTAGAFMHNTFVAALSARFPRTDGAAWLEPAHRLDRETSGVLVLVRHRDAARALQAQFERGDVQKRYTAVVHGTVTTEHLVIDAPLCGPARGAAVPRSRVAATGDGGKRAHTEARVEQRLRDATVLQMTPSTGRRHQIRAHLAHVGHPLVGDKLYGQSDARYLAYVQHLKADGDPRWPGELPTARQLLHAEFLQLRHPRTGDELRLSAPRPHDLCAFIAAHTAQN